MGEFAITCQWQSALNEPPEVGETSAMLKIDVGSNRVTRNEDSWSRTVRDEAHLSAYPLALWFAASWWRLRWEFLPASLPKHSWRMAHEVAAAGYGYVWPRMLFAFDGESMLIWATQSKPESSATVRYLMDVHQGIPCTAYERVLDGFLNTVIARLDAVGLKQTALHELWKEVVDERSDCEMADYRRLEAMLGFDPDDCPETLHNQFAKLIPQAGADAIAEIAPVCAASDPGKKLNEIIELSRLEGLEGEVDIFLNQVSKADLPWERGRATATQVRSQAGLNGGFLDNKKLCGLLGLSEKDVFETQLCPRLPLGLSIRQRNSKRSKFLLSKPNPHGRRFELARHLGNHLIASVGDTWLPVTNTKTARQKFQRAFAAELLCPIQGIREYLNDDFSSDAIADASEYFHVSEEAVHHQLVNNHIIARRGYDFLDFPYVTGAKAS